MWHGCFSCRACVLCSNAASYASQQLSIIVDKPSPQLKDDNNEDGVDVVMSNTRTLLLRYQQCLLSHFIACNNSLNVTGDVISLSGGITGCFFFACCYFPYFPLSLQCLLGWAASWQVENTLHQSQSLLSTNLPPN